MLSNADALEATLQTLPAKLGDPGSVEIVVVSPSPFTDTGRLPIEPPTTSVYEPSSGVSGVVRGIWFTAVQPSAMESCAEAHDGCLMGL